MSIIVMTQKKKQQWLYQFVLSLYLNECILLHRNDTSIFIIATQSNAQLLDQR